MMSSLVGSRSTYPLVHRVCQHGGGESSTEGLAAETRQIVSETDGSRGLGPTVPQGRGMIN